MTATAALDRPAQSSAPGGRFRLRGRPHKLALTAHILTSVGWFGIAVVVAACGIAAAGTEDSSLSHALYRVMETGPWLSVPFGVASVATGVLLGIGTIYGLVRYWWVVAKIVIAIVVIVTDALLVGRTAHDALVSGTAHEPIYGSTIAHVVVLIVATVLSVYKPRWRTPRGQRSGTRKVTRSHSNESVSVPST